MTDTDTRLTYALDRVLGLLTEAWGREYHVTATPEGFRAVHRANRGVVTAPTAQGLWDQLPVHTARMVEDQHPKWESGAVLAGGATTSPRGRRVRANRESASRRHRNRPNSGHRLRRSAPPPLGAPSGGGYGPGRSAATR